MSKLDKLIETILLTEKLWKITVIRIPRGTPVRKKYDSKLRNTRYLKKKYIKEHKKQVGDVYPL
ncbi:hypothetical protein LCGC14_1926300 [marine sediment metagenome]|uniref:Uncharacterized protein n=1 Tax=marine sediment metagenome TaxID=412755 RepID=A0A0F9I346_9ZZZZ